MQTIGKKRLGKTTIAGAAAVLALGLGFGAAADSATAMPVTPAGAGTVAAIRDSSPLRQIHVVCRCGRTWPHRQYWQWDNHPIWDNPWLVLKPNFWGSPEPHLVPAAIWACKWHLPSARPWTPSWRRHPRQCRPWHY